MKNTVKSEDPVAYGAAPSDDQIVAQALAILERRVHRGDVIQSPQSVKDYLRVRLAPLEYECFTVLFLSSQHHVIECREMFRGTLTQASVYPREVVKAALGVNAGAVILAHNHPSGLAEPSRADESLTRVLKEALNLIDVRVLDHIVVAGSGAVSMAERGLI